MRPGHSHRPLWTYLLAVAFILSPFCNVAISLFLEKVPGWWRPELWLRAFSYVPFHELFFQTLILAAGLTLLAVRRFAWQVSLVALSLTIINSIFLMWKSRGISDFLPHAFLAFVTCAIAAFFFLPYVKELYFNPRTRWWEIPPRFEVTNAKVEIPELGAQAKLLDVSRTGALIELAQTSSNETFQVGDFYRVEVALLSLSAIMKCVRSHERFRGLEFYIASPLQWWRVRRWSRGAKLKR